MIKTDMLPEAEFADSLFAVYEHLRGALTELLTSVSADPAVPYAASRQLGINKNLAWKICRIITAHDPFAAIEHLPGTQGMNILLDAAAKHGAPPTVIGEVRVALKKLAQLIETHAGDRRTLDLMVASHHESPQEPMEESRRLAFEGNSAIWGVKGRVRFASFIVAPSGGDDGFVDCAVIGGVVDACRLRPNVSVPLFQLRAYNDDGSTINMRRKPLDPDAEPSDGSMLIRPFCSQNVPPLSKTRRDDALCYAMPRGPVGRSGLSSWIYGWRTVRLASAYRDAVNRFGEHPMRVFVPVEALQCDLYLHRDLPFGESVRGILYSQLAGEQYDGADHAGDQLPLRESVTRLGGRPPVAASPLLPRYSEMIRWAFERLAWNARDFAGYRFTMKYPPIPTVFVLRYDLAERGV